MDIARPKKQMPNLKRNLAVVAGALLTLLLASYLWSLSRTDFVADSKSMVISQVQRGDFVISVRGTGVLVPAQVQWLAANVEARVERLVVKPGKQVQAGDLIVELSNPQLLQQYEETLWEAEALEAETIAQQVALESSLLDQQSIMLNAKLNFESSQMKQKAQATLYQQKSGAISLLDYENTRMQTEQLQQKWQIEQARFTKMEENLAAQKNAFKARLNKMNKTLERFKQQVDSLQVKASIESVVQELPLEPGQQIPAGTNIAKLVKQDQLIAELKIPELQIREIAVGQRVLIDTRNSQFEGRVSRIDPAVVSGNVLVDVEFDAPLPADARPDLTIDGEIRVAELADTLHVSRPLFAQSQSQTGLYRVSEDGQSAERITVQLGRGSINQIQVLAGLEAGDRIIISDSTQFETYPKIRIN